MKILIVEDNTTTTTHLSNGFASHYITSDIAHNGQDGLHLACNNQYDLIILDVMLPKLDGFSVLSQLREQKITTPVIFLTAKDMLDDRLKGFDLGADDYLVKPFSFSELLARVRAISHRQTKVNSDLIEIADLRIDNKRHKITRANKNITLSAKEFMLVLLLANHQGEVLTRTFITEQVWDINFDTETNVIDVAIKRLREKIDNDFDQKLIHTVRGVGYVLELR